MSGPTGRLRRDEAEIQQVPVVRNNTDKTREWIESLELAGIHVNNWQRRTVKLYLDPDDADFAYSIGRFHDGSTIVVAREKLCECMNFRIALDYWRHGQKTYTRD